VTDPQQLDIGAVAAEMERDPLSKALFENAQLRVIVRQQAARIEELAAQRNGDGSA
jgi:hypothetical protein